jgi:hypothetical protein
VEFWKEGQSVAEQELQGGDDEGPDPVGLRLQGQVLQVIDRAYEHLPHVRTVHQRWKLCFR